MSSRRNFKMNGMADIESAAMAQNPAAPNRP
jgi:hypothetical protein